MISTFFFLFFFFYRFLKKFLNVCKNAVSPELQEAKKKASASKITLTQDMDNIAELKKVLQEVNIHKCLCMSQQLIFEILYSLGILASL